MSLTASISPGEHAFTGNPVWLSVESSSMATYTVSNMLGGVLFRGKGIGRFKVNVGEILETVFADVPVLGGGGDLLTIVPFCNRAFISISVENAEGDRSELSFNAWRGGISKHSFRQLHEEGTDIFSLKFLNASCNFFFTTRSDDWRIMIRETELYPLCFIYPEHELRITELLTGQSLSVPGVTGIFCALDLEAVRFKFFTEYGVLSNFFDIFSGDLFSCRIGIVESPSVRERYHLRFLNSYGAYELFSLEGEAVVTPGMDEDEGTVFRRYDEVLDDYRSEHSRRPLHDVIRIKTGFKRPDEIGFLLDLLSSDAVYLCGYCRHDVKVLPSVEDFSFSRVMKSPQNITLHLSVVEGEFFHTRDISPEGYAKPRVHSDEFSEQFN